MKDIPYYTYYERVREVNNLTQDQLAENLKLNKKTIYRCEKGEKTSKYTQKAYSEYFGVNFLACDPKELADPVAYIKYMQRKGYDYYFVFGDSLDLGVSSMWVGFDENMNELRIPRPINDPTSFFDFPIKIIECDFDWGTFLFSNTKIALLRNDFNKKRNIFPEEPRISKIDEIDNFNRAKNYYLEVLGGHENEPKTH